MTKEILKLSATFLGLYDVVAYLNNPTQNMSEDTKKQLDELLIYMNYILREVTKEYYPLSCEEEIYSNSQCEILFSNFSKNIISIKSVLNDNNFATYNIYPTYIKVGKPNTKYKVSFNYVLDSVKSFDSEVVLPLGLEPFIISYGIASEYATSKLQYDEANMWESKFKNALQSLKFRVIERKFNSRRLKW